jgi:hypothetical protein
MTPAVMRATQHRPVDASAALHLVHDGAYEWMREESAPQPIIIVPEGDDAYVQSGPSDGGTAATVGDNSTLGWYRPRGLDRWRAARFHGFRQSGLGWPMRTAALASTASANVVSAPHAAEEALRVGFATEVKDAVFA